MGTGGPHQPDEPAWGVPVFAQPDEPEPAPSPEGGTDGLITANSGYFVFIFIRKYCYIFIYKRT